jgi:dTDP-4-dehydrorhamnose 3,5-epimerase
MIEGLRLLTLPVFRDQRGFFCELFRQEQFSIPFVQDNLSFSVKNTLRGLHVSNQDKLVMCLQGKIFDVAVDLRPGSPTFGQWESVLLEGERQFYIPQGFAHGFCVLSDTALVYYKVTQYYDAKKERSIRWDDPDLRIKWPIEDPILSDKDRQNPLLKEIAHALDSRR